jgi:hypothetical protein
VLNVRTPHTGNAEELTHWIDRHFSAGTKSHDRCRGFTLRDLLPVFRAADNLLFWNFGGSRGLQPAGKDTSNQCAFRRGSFAVAPRHRFSAACEAGFAVEKGQTRG